METATDVLTLEQRADRCRKLLKYHEVPYSKVAEKIGYHPSYVRSVLSKSGSGDRRPSPNVISAIEEAFVGEPQL